MFIPIPNKISSQLGIDNQLEFEMELIDQKLVIKTISEDEMVNRITVENKP